MATSTMLRSVYIRQNDQCRKLVSALERAEEARDKHPTPAKEVHDMTPEQMQKLFGKPQK